MVQKTGASGLKGGGALKGLGETFQPNEFSGASSFIVPLFTSPCRKSAPKLSLRYNSTDGNGPFGLGFDVSVPKITRRTEHGIPKYDGSDVFVLSSEAELVELDEPDSGWPSSDPDHRITRFHPTNVVDVNRIELWRNAQDGTEHWRIWSPDNVLNIYGDSPDSRIEDGNGRVYGWLLSSTQDARGNRTKFCYRSEGSADTVAGRDLSTARYLDRICYGAMGFGSDCDWLFEVVFDYGERDLSGSVRPAYGPEKDWALRSDPFSKYRPGFEIRTQRLCRGVIMFHHGALAASGGAGGPAGKDTSKDPFAVHATCFDYDTAATGAQIRSIRQYGFGSGDGGEAIEELPRLDFEFSRSGPPCLGRLAPEMMSHLAEGLVSDTLAAELSRKNILIADASEASLSPAEGENWRLEVGEMQYRLVPDDLGGAFVEEVSNPEIFQTVMVDDGTKKGAPLTASQPVFVDLLGEGLPGILLEAEAAYRDVPYYVRPLGQGRFAAPQPLRKPVGAAASVPHHSTRNYRDQTFDGLPDLVFETETGAGFFENSGNDRWDRYQPYVSFPLEGSAPHGQVADVTGDGIGDVLTLSNTRLRYYPSQGRDGFQQAVERTAPRDFEAGAADHGHRATRFADIFGDGGAHCVEVRSRSVRCWPNLGHGAFGPAVSLDNAPDLGRNFDPRRVLFSDVDGSGTADIVYVSATHIDLYRNESGNRLSNGQRIDLPYPCPDPSAVKFADLWGNGTQALVVTVERPDKSRRTLFLNLEPNGKPYLLTGVDDMSGNSVRVTYRSSTEEYLAARKDGDPWRSRFAFPIQVVTRIETVDHISGARTLTRYRYRDGFYDADRRQVCGFGQVDKFDSDEAIDPSVSATCTPQLQRMWYHTGAAGLLDHFEDDWRARSLAPKDEARLPGTVLIGFAKAGARALAEADKPLRGRMLRKETYALDPASSDTPKSAPLRVEMHNQSVRLLQDARPGRLPVYMAKASETLSITYDGCSDDPRLSHRLVLSSDAFGHVQQVCQLSYPRRRGENTDAFAEQLRTIAQLNTTEHCVPRDEATVFLHGHVARTGSWELRDVDGIDQKLVSLKALKDRSSPLAGLKAKAGPADRERSRTRHYYWDDDQKDAAGLRHIGAAGLPHHTEEAFLGDAEFDECYGTAISPKQMRKAGGYKNALGYWWRPSAVQHFADADGHFQPVKRVDPLNGTMTMRYDAHGLMVVGTTDALGHETCVQGIDPHTLQPVKSIDANDTVTERRSDAMGMQTAMSRYGEIDGTKAGEAPLAEHQHPTERDIVALCADPDRFLQSATSVTIVDRLAWQNSRSPPWTVHISRAQSDGAESAQPSAVAVSYFDGFGEVLQRKTAHAKGRSAFVVSGYRTYDHKGEVQEIFEDFFSADPTFEPRPDHISQVRLSHKSTDALGRVVETLHPGGFVSRMEHRAWSRLAFDQNDLWQDMDPEAKAQLQPVELRALQSADDHARTPTEFALNPRGQNFLIIDRLSADAEEDDLHLQLADVDYDGKHLRQYDPRAISPSVLKKSAAPLAPISERCYAMTGTQTWSRSADRNTLTTLMNIHGNPIYRKDARGQETWIDYNKAQQPLTMRVRRESSTGEATETIVQRIEYGGSDAKARASNCAGQQVRTWDQAGKITFKAYDLVGHPTRTIRRFRQDPVGAHDWPDKGRDKVLEAAKYERRCEHDLMGRLVRDTYVGLGEIHYGYWRTGWMQDIRAGHDRSMIAAIDYTPTGRKSMLRYGNGVVTQFHHHAITRRLTQIASARSDGSRPFQDIAYYYDPIGNVAGIHDRSFAEHLEGRAAKLTPDWLTYDPLYRLVGATGSEDRDASDGSEPGRAPPMRPIDDKAELPIAGYEKAFSYDKADNLTSMTHRQDGAGTPDWSRHFEVVPGGNRGLPRPQDDAEIDWDQAFDPNGNRVALDQGVSAVWDHRNQLVSLTTSGERPKASHFLHNGHGLRVRMLTCDDAQGLDDPARRDEVHLGDLRLVRAPQTRGDAQVMAGDHVSLDLHAGGQKVASLRHVHGSGVPAAPVYLIEDRQGSVSFELDQAANILSYEQYYPFGETSFRAARSAQPEKPFRYAGKPQTEIGGLYAFDARLYDPKMGRWISPDPGGDVDGQNHYAYVHGNPLSQVDYLGFCADEDEHEASAPFSLPLPHLSDEHMEELMEMHPDDITKQMANYAILVDPESWFSQKGGAAKGWIHGLKDAKQKKQARALNALIAGYRKSARAEYENIDQAMEKVDSGSLFGIAGDVAGSVASGAGAAAGTVTMGAGTVVGGLTYAGQNKLRRKEAAARSEAAGAFRGPDGRPGTAGTNMLMSGFAHNNDVQSDQKINGYKWYKDLAPIWGFIRAITRHNRDYAEIGENNIPTIRVALNKAQSQMRI